VLRETRIHEPDDKTIWTTNAGETVHGQAVRRARAQGWLKPLPDGLFGDAQSYVYGEPPDAPV